MITLRTELETLKALAERPPARVRMPDPRPAREDAKRALFACIGDRSNLVALRAGLTQNGSR